MKRITVLSLLLGLLSLGSLAIAGDTMSAGDGCPPGCPDCSACCGTACPIGD